MTDRRRLEKCSRKVGGSIEEGRAEIFCCPLGLAMLAVLFRTIFTASASASAQDPFCYSRKPTETTHSPHPPSGQHNCSSTRPESLLAMAVSSGCCAACHQQTSFRKWRGLPAFWCRPSPGAVKQKPNPNQITCICWGEGKVRPNVEGTNALPGGKHCLLSDELNLLL